jgi:hypothetical protein
MLVQVLVALWQRVTTDRGGVDPAARVLVQVRVDSLVREEQRERGLPFLLHEIDGPGIQDVGHVALDLVLAAVLPQDGIVQLALPLEADPVVVAGARAGIIAHVPLADVCGFIPQRLEGQVVVVEAVAGDVAADVVDDAVARCVLPCEDRCAVGRAERRRMERVFEHRPFARDPVDVGGLHVRVTGRACLVEAQVVDQDHDEVGFLCHGRDLR